MLWASSASYTFQLSVSYTTMRAFKKLLSGKTHVYLFKNSASQKRQREAILGEKIQGCQLFPIFYWYFQFLRKCKWSKSTIHIRILQQLNWFATLYMYSWQHCKRRKKEKPKNLNEMLHRSLFEEKSVDKAGWFDGRNCILINLQIWFFFIWITYLNQLIKLASKNSNQFRLDS